MYTIFEGYLFKQLYLSLSSNKVKKSGGRQLARLYIYSSMRWTSCCCASWCRAALHQHLLETGGRGRMEQLLLKKRRQMGNPVFYS